MLLKNAVVLYGKDLELREGVDILIEDGRFKGVRRDISHTNSEVYDIEGSLVIPGLINAHTHIGDSIGKDAAVEEGLNSRIHPVHGIKKAILSKTPRDQLVTHIRASALSMLRHGITCFADFREDGISGIELLREALEDVDIRCLTFGRVDYYCDYQAVRSNDDLPSAVIDDAKNVIKECDGFGISGANEYSDKALARFAEIAREYRKSVAIHAAESQSTKETSLQISGRNEVQRILHCLRPDLLVHMTSADEEDLALVAKNSTGIVVCPRSNGVLGGGIPNIPLMLKHGCKVALGTDNIMLNSPDLFREMDYTWKISRAIGAPMINAREVVKMATVNAAEVLKRGSIGYIQENMLADAVFIDRYSLDVEPMHDPYASIVHRVNDGAVIAVMVGGKLVHGNL